VQGLDGCYWVEEGCFLASPYPHARDRITRLRNLGATLFLDLTEPGEYGSLPYDGLHTGRMRGDSQAASRLHGAARGEMSSIVIDSELAAGGVVYLHCYGGLGLTGTAVGCYLVRHGTPPEDAIEAIGRLRADTGKADWPSPESEERCRLVESCARD
jgi:Swiss Army Knife protein, DSP-PTPase phosphatase domain